MAKRRMFSLDVIDTDDFLDMPASAQSLYFHLGMRADDDGFVSSPRKITKIVNCGADDFKILITKGYIIPFESGVCVVRDWKTNNYIQPDRYHKTRYTEEKNQLKEAENGQYFLSNTVCIHDVSNTATNSIQPVSKPDTEDRLGYREVNLGYREDRGGKERVSGEGNQTTAKMAPSESTSKEDCFEKMRESKLEMLHASFPEMASVFG